MTKTTVDQRNRADQTAIATLAAELNALTTLHGEVVRQLATLARVKLALPVDAFLRKTTPDALLDAWQAARGQKAEAYLLDRIYRRRAARRAAL